MGDRFRVLFWSPLHGAEDAEVDPRQARRFAEAIGRHAKTDALDAAMLARFAALLERRARQRLGQIERQLATIDTALHATLAADPASQARFDILVSIPGVGETTAFAMLVEMPELGAIAHKGAASLAGLAPMARDSDRHRGKRFIRGGRARLRQALSMPAHVAVRFNTGSSR